jgi:hypothetical protein
MDTEGNDGHVLISGTFVALAMLGGSQFAQHGASSGCGWRGPPAMEGACENTE